MRASILYAAAFAACALAFTFTPMERPDLTALFDPQQQGWLGADVSTSLSLVPNASYGEAYLWMWGDTAVGSLVDVNGTEQRAMTGMCHSSVAIVNASAGALQPPEFFLPMQDGELNSMGFFTPQSGPAGAFYWITDGLVGPETGYLFILAMTTISTPGKGIGFSTIGTDLIVVYNPLDPPALWTYKTIRVPTSSVYITWTLGMAIDPTDGYIHIMGMHDILKIDNQIITARVQESDLATLNVNAIEYYNIEGQWVTNTGGFILYKHMFPSAASEATLMYSDYMESWYMFLLQGLASAVSIATAPSITGPWTVQSVYPIPSTFTGPNVFTYAAKAHPEYSSAPNELIFTYNTNGGGLAGLKNATIYHPQFVQLTIS